MYLMKQSGLLLDGDIAKAGKRKAENEKKLFEIVYGTRQQNERGRNEEDAAALYCDDEVDIMQLGADLGALH